MAVALDYVGGVGDVGWSGDVPLCGVFGWSFGFHWTRLDCIELGLTGLYRVALPCVVSHSIALKRYGLIWVRRVLAGMERSGLDWTGYSGVDKTSLAWPGPDRTK